MRDDYNPSDLLQDSLSRSNVVIYPVSDSESLFDDIFFDCIERIFGEYNDSIIGISTKNTILFDAIDRIKNTNEKQQSLNSGNFIKINVAFTNINQISEIESGCATYEERIQLLKSLKHHKVPCSVSIKPILPFISIEEYKKIIDDTIVFSNCYVLGDLYVDEGSEFFKNYFQESEKTKLKTVSWLNTKPKWLVAESPHIKLELHKYIAENNGVSFENDREMLNYAFMQ